MIGFLSFLSKINNTTLPYLFVLCYFIQVLLSVGFVGDIDTVVVYSRKPTYLDSANTLSVS